MDHKKLDTWKEAIELVVKIYNLNEKLPEEEKYGLSSQIKRASISVPSNIAEGAGRNSNKEQIQFLKYALASLSEVETQLIIINRVYNVSVDIELDQLVKVRKLISGLMSYLKNKTTDNYVNEDTLEYETVHGPQITVHESPFLAHETAVIDEGCEIGKGTKIWHFSHIMSHCQIGEDCNIGQNVVVSPHVKLGKNVKVQNNVSIYTGVICEDDVFLGPSMVFTNIVNPRSAVVRKDQYVKTLVEKGVSIGANATIVCGHTIGKFAFIGAGAVVTKEVKPYALLVGNPAKQVGWMSEYGHRLNFDDQGVAVCPESGEKYKLDNDHVSKVETGDGKRETGN